MTNSLQAGTFKKNPFHGLRVEQQNPLGLDAGNPPGFSFSAKPSHGHAESSGCWSDW